jgi:hypothetical protein
MDAGNKTRIVLQASMSNLISPKIPEYTLCIAKQYFLLYFHFFGPNENCGNLLAT